MRKLIFVMFCFASSGFGAEFLPPQIPSTKPEPRVEKLLRNEVHYLLNSSSWAEIPNEQEHAIRAWTSTALSAAVCMKFAGCPAQETQPVAVHILREVTRTHLTGGGKTASGKAWGHQWQSSFWAWQAAFAAWLLWPELPDDLRAPVVTMAVDEADRFADLPAPYSEFLDTKAEENAWNSMILVLVSEALPTHPHHAQWRARALEYMISAFATRADRSNNKIVDGRPVRAWVKGPNAHSDFTLENHRIVHPDYMSTFSLNLINAIVYRLLGKPVPEAVFFNAREVYENLKLFTLPDGSLFYPNGTDWSLHRVDMTWEGHVQMERLAHDRQAGALAEAALDTLEKMQARNRSGSIFAPGEFPSYPPHEPNAGWVVSMGLLTMKLWAPPANPQPLGTVWKELEKGQMFEDGKFFLMRTAHSLSSCAWGLRVMAVTIPFTSDPILNPMNHSYVGLATPLEEGADKLGRTGIGSMALERAIDREAMVISTVMPTAESGAMHVTVLASQGGLPHIFSFTALPSGKSVYMERWGRTSASVQGGLISLLQEPAWVYGRAARDVQAAGRDWVNVDDRMGFALSGCGGVKKTPEVASLLVALNATPQADCAIVTLPGATGAETRQFSSRPFRLRVNDPDAAAVAVDGFIVATNFSSSPTTLNVESAGEIVRIPIYGYSTRVLVKK